MSEQPVRVTYCGMEENFLTSKEAYLWLIRQFMMAKPNLLESEMDKPYINTGRGRRHFARSPQELYIKSPHLIDKSHYYAALPGGWFANVHLNNPNEKLKILELLSKAAGLEPTREWTWHEIGAARTITADDLDDVC